MQRSLADSRVKFRHLQCFLAVAQFGGVQKAAERLAITQPAVSKTVAELEAILGVRLFERGRHGAVPTREGQLFMPHASACVSALRQGVDLLARAEGTTAATLDFGILPTVAAALVPSALRLFSAQWPRVIVRLATGANTDLLEKLKAGTIEFAVGRLADPERMVGLSFEQLFSEPLIAVVRAGHPIASSAGLPVALLEQYPVVLPPPGTLIRQSADSLLTAWGVPPLSAFIEVLSVSMGRALALENDAVWFVPLSAVEYELAHRMLVRLPLPFAGTDEPVGLIRRSDTQPSAAGRALIESMRHVALQRMTTVGAVATAPKAGSNASVNGSVGASANASPGRQNGTTGSTTAVTTGATTASTTRSRPASRTRSSAAPGDTPKRRRKAG
ncbi:pca operon transcription factor PcaQ [Paraburkholderia sp.]|uniref:pca operon transcription factor PcaQ n=1 Tax=Paraburkholderia sp. TaxID=1926495 RepID=UPI0023A73EE5|nr:pca operon transcription factor PcaQ [Paraburkholderia sp.]MDE1182217.1 pca operon transcription factor PcaQ [Paraburkholderia sp.]